MCIMCVEIMKDRMNLKEVVRARGEFVPPANHEEELDNVIIEKFGWKEYWEEVMRDYRAKQLDIIVPTAPGFKLVKK